MERVEIGDKAVDALYARLDREAEQGGYHLNPDVEFTKGLVRSLAINQDRYGYPACPCRLASGLKADDIDIICPCDYRDPDLNDFGTCYCALYVSGDVVAGRSRPGPIPERRPPEEERKKVREAAAKPQFQGPLYSATLPVWRCKVCGYLCARDAPPEVCPICRATKERFEQLAGGGVAPIPVWRCSVCGYLCAREQAPEVCPVCKAKRDRFNRFL